MKPIPAIVESAAIDVGLLESQLAIALAGKSDAERSAERLERLALSARETAKMRRLEIGRILTKLRGAWPERGPNAKPWGELLAKHKLAESTARMYMDEYRDPKGFAEKSAKTSGPGDHDRDAEPANVNGGSGAPARGAYCTPLKYAMAVGTWDLDPFSNPRSHIVAAERCMLESGDDGLLDPELSGSYLIAPKTDDERKVARYNRAAFVHRAGATARVWIQPPYDIVEQAIAHYGHTRFCALLRFDPSTDWFAALWKLTRVIAIPFGERLEFEAAPGIETSANPYPHAFYYADERDVTDEIRRLCIVLRVDHQTANP